MTVYAKHVSGSEWRLCRQDEPGATRCEIAGYVGDLAQVRVPGGGLMTVPTSALAEPEPPKAVKFTK